MTRSTGSSADVIDVRDLIERFEELESTYGELPTPNNWPDDMERGEDYDESEHDEFLAIKSLLEDLEGNGGDHQWRGSWYPVSLIRDSYFEDYAREFADDIGAIDSNAGWPTACIDWEKAADELQMDYTSAEYDGVTFWYR